MTDSDQTDRGPLGGWGEGPVSIWCDFVESGRSYANFSVFGVLAILHSSSANIFKVGVKSSNFQGRFSQRWDNFGLLKPFSSDTYFSRYSSFRGTVTRNFQIGVRVSNGHNSLRF